MSNRIRFALLFLASFLLLCLLPIHHSLYSTLFSADINKAFSFSHANGFYEDELSISMSLSSPRMRRLQIRYTLDGSTPNSFSPLYTKPLTYTAEDALEVITIKAIVCDKNGISVGGPYTATYILGNQNLSLQNALVVSITADAAELYSPERGILYPMADCGPTEEDWNWFKRQNCKQRGDAWIRSAHIDIFEPDGTNVISQNIGLCVDGDHGSMTHYPYSLKILADSRYDAANPSFSYDFFHYYNTSGTSFPHIQKFNNLVFRNGGNEYNAGVKDPEQRGTMLRWNIGSRLADEAGFIVAGARPAVIFLNGELYSVAQLQDTYNRYNTASKTLLNKDSLEVFKDAERACTQSGGYEALYYSYPDIENSPILLPENQAAMEQTVAIDDMFAYYAFEVLINNTDFPKKNYAIWRTLDTSGNTPWSDGKFRFLINDLDCTWDFRSDDDLWTAYFDRIKEDGTVMGSLIQIPAYRIRFVNILCDLMNSGLFDRSHLETVINEADLEFHSIASFYYTAEDEAKREQNVAFLKESAFARKGKVQGFLRDTFSPTSPYTLCVKAPAAGSSIHFSTTDITSKSGDFKGLYYGDYPLTIQAFCNDYQKFSYWLINGEKVTSSKVTLDASLIQNGKITVELITEASSYSGLCISEVCTAPENAWIEIFNASSQPLSLKDYSLSNNLPARLLRFPLPDQILQPGETFVAGVDNTGVFRLENGASIYLLKENLVLDSLSIPFMARSESYGRFGETNSWRYYATPTPWSCN